MIELEVFPLRAVDVPCPEAEHTVVSTTARGRLRAMFQEHFTFIWRVLRRLGVAAQSVDDAAQQVFFVATRRVNDIQAGSERAFLLSTAMRIASEARRAGARSRELPYDELDARAHPAPSPEQLTEQKHALEALDAVLDAIPFELRTAFVLFEIEGLSTLEIAALLGIPRGTVASRLRRAREEFEAAAVRIRARAAFRGGAP